MVEHTDKVKGKMKQAVGKVTGDDRLEREGKRNVARGKAEGVVNKTKSKVKDAKHAVEDSGE